MIIQGSSIVVTGGLGAIGSTLNRALLSQGVGSITILDDCSSSVEDLSRDILDDKRVTFIRRSIVDDAALDEAFLSKPTIVFHLAANFANQNSVDRPIVDCEVNSLGTAKVLEWSRRTGVQKLVFASSSCVYGSRGSFAVDSIDFHPETPYAVNKLHGEYQVQFYHRFHRMNTTILRFFNSFGPGELPGQYRNVIPNFFALAMQGKPLPITGDKTTSRDFNYIENTVAATIASVTSAVSGGKIYNVGSGQEITIYELAEAINRIAGNRAGIEMRPARNWDSINHRCADISLTVAELGYAPVIDFQNQLQATYAWLRGNETHFAQ